MKVTNKVENLKNKKIKYSPFTILLMTINLMVFTYMFILIFVESKSSILIHFLMFLTAILCSFIFLTWIILFFIPFILGQPALILSEETLFINVINQSIPWTEIHQTKIKRTRNNDIISIFVIDEDKVFTRPSLFFKNLICAINYNIHSTPFCLWTMFLKGRGIDIYNEINSFHAKAQLSKLR